MKREIRKVIRFKNNISDDVIQFINLQSNFSESMTYLIEKEIYQNGYNDLIYHIPIIRSNDYWEELFENSKDNESKEVKNNIENKSVKSEVKNKNKDDKLNIRAYID